MRVRGLSKHLLVELCKCFPSPLSFLPPPNSFRLSWDCTSTLRRVFVRESAFLRRNVLPADDPFLRQQKQRCSSPLSPPSLFGKFYSCWYARRSRDIWRFDIDVSVSGFRPPPPPFSPLFSSIHFSSLSPRLSRLPRSPRMNGKGESAADNADKLPSKSLLCVCAPYRSPSLAPFPHHRRSPPPPSIDPPLRAVSSWLLASERGNAFAEVILSFEGRESVVVVSSTVDGRSTPPANC